MSFTLLSPLSTLQLSVIKDILLLVINKSLLFSVSLLDYALVNIFYFFVKMLDNSIYLVPFRYLWLLHRSNSHSSYEKFRRWCPDRTNVAYTRFGAQRTEKNEFRKLIIIMNTWKWKYFNILFTYLTTFDHPNEKWSPLVWCVDSTSCRFKCVSSLRLALIP